MAHSVPDLTQAIRVGELGFESKFKAANVAGPNPRTAFGGASMAFALHCAHATVGEAFHLYSATGSFLSAATTDKKLEGRVSKVRDTQNFATRRIDVGQKDPGEPLRLVMTLLADFQVPESDSMLEYDLMPSIPINSVEDSWTMDQMYENALSKGVSAKLVEGHRKRFGITSKYFERRLCPDAVGSQNLFGMLPQATTSQDDLHITDKRTSNWWRSWDELASQADNVSCIAFIMDAGTAIIPPSFAGIDLKEIGAVASLDFALRIFANDIRFHQWHSREEKTCVARSGRTFQEVHIRDQGGRSVAQMSMQCILRRRRSLLPNL